MGDNPQHLLSRHRLGGSRCRSIPFSTCAIFLVLLLSSANPRGIKPGGWSKLRRWSVVDGRTAMAFVLGCCGHRGRVLLCVSSSGRVAALVWAKNAAGFSSGGSRPILSSSVENASHFAALPGPLLLCSLSVCWDPSTHHRHRPATSRRWPCIFTYVLLYTCIWHFRSAPPFSAPVLFLRFAPARSTAEPWVEALLPSVSPSLRSFGWDLLRHAATRAHCSLPPYIHT